MHADQAYQKYAPRSIEWAWRFRIQKAQILIRRGSFGEALSLLDQEIPPSLAKTDVIVRAKLARALAFQYSQKPDLADKELTEASQIAASVKPELLGDIANQKGMLEVDLKHYPQAGNAFHSALDAYRQQKLPLNEASALANLGYLAMWQDHYDESSEWFKLALEKSQQTNSQFALAKTLGNVGWNYEAVGDFENAEIMFNRAVKASEDSGLEGDRIYWLNALGGVYSLQHRYAEAAATSEQALGPARRMDSKRTLVECLNLLAEVSLAIGQIERAEAYNREAIETQNAGLDNSGILQSRLIAGRIATSRHRYAEAVELFRRALTDPTAKQAQQWQAQALLAQTYADADNALAAEANFRQAIKTIEDAWFSIKREEFRLSFLSTVIDFYDQYVNFLISRNRPADALQVANLSRAQTLEWGLSSDRKQAKSGAQSAFHPQDIARRQNATLLFYWLGENRSYLWVITPSKMQLLPLPASSEIDASAKSYRESFLDPRDPFESGNTDGQKLYDVLIRSAEKFIPKNSRVILLPDGSLNGLNFETLIVSGPQPHYWIEDVTVSVANSLVLLARSNREPPPKSGNLLFFGNAISASKDYPPLPDSGREADILKKYFSEARSSVFTGANAKASQYLSSNPAQFSYLHFATHGTASRTRPLESAIILSPEGDSFKLYARDIVEHPIHSFLVTISACDGAGKRVYAGEGLVGLSWAFLRAGAHNVVAGLWEVSSASTPQLMDELYKGVSAGQDPATALRNAKLSLLHSGGIYKRPFYWAPFQLYSGS